jgi:hypothetical protein
MVGAGDSRRVHQRFTDPLITRSLKTGQSQYFLDLTQALGEVNDIYERSRIDAPSLEQLLRSVDRAIQPEHLSVRPV